MREKKMNKRRMTTLMICRAGLIAALYVALTLPFGELAFGPIQIRPSEALTVLPLFYVEAIPGLYVGCMLTNMISTWGVYDIFLGSLATLFAAGCTFVTGILIKKPLLKVLVGGVFPIIFNAFLVPVVIMLAGGEIAYWTMFAELLLNESIWVYSLGIPLFYALKALIKKQVKGVMPCALQKRKSEGEQSTK